MKKLKKIFSLVLVAAMVLSMNLTSFAAEETTSGLYTHVAATVEGLTSITVGSTAATIEKDVKGGEEQSQIYARARLADSSEYALKSQQVTIVSSKAPTCSELNFTSTDAGYVATANLLNKAYNVKIGDTTVVLAAGLPDGEVKVDRNDPLSASNLKLINSETTLTGQNAENNCEGNADFGSQPWTNVVYQFKTNTALAAGTDLSSVEGSMTVASGATVSGCASATSDGYVFDLSGENPYFVVTNNGESRNYYVSAAVKSEDGMQVTYAINLTEVVGDEAYAETFAANCTQILDGTEKYFESIGAEDIDKTDDSISALITVPIGTNAMQPMLDLTEWATSKGYFKFATKNNGTYLAKLNGLGEFDCGQLSGWMYTDSVNGYEETCTGPNVGAASYTMSDGQVITWYMTSNYFNHF